MKSKIHAIQVLNELKSDVQALQLRHENFLKECHKFQLKSHEVVSEINEDSTFIRIIDDKINKIKSGSEKFEVTKSAHELIAKIECSSRKLLELKPLIRIDSTAKLAYQVGLDILKHIQELSECN